MLNTAWLSFRLKAARSLKNTPQRGNSSIVSDLRTRARVILRSASLFSCHCLQSHDSQGGFHSVGLYNGIRDHEAAGGTYRVMWARSEIRLRLCLDLEGELFKLGPMESI